MVGYCPKCGRWLDTTSGYCCCGYAPNLLKMASNTSMSTLWQDGFDMGWKKGYAEGLIDGNKKSKS